MIRRWFERRCHAAYDDTVTAANALAALYGTPGQRAAESVLQRFRRRFYRWDTAYFILWGAR